jgi:hypothetical protein
MQAQIVFSFVHVIDTIIWTKPQLFEQNTWKNHQEHT